MIIDCHGHYTTFPKEVDEIRAKQKEQIAGDANFQAQKITMDLSDDAIRESIINNQLKLQQARGTDITIFSPRASWMGHHIGNSSTSLYWSQYCNDLIKRVCELFPENFVPVCQLPQSPVTPIQQSIDELKRCVEEMGFIGCNLNPDPSGGYWQDKPLGDKYWYPFYEKMVELHVPAMIHVSGACHPCLHTTSSYYLGADTTAFQHLMMSEVFTDFPTIKFIIPHGGGAVPYHWGRFRGMSEDMNLGDLGARVLNNIFFDTCVYHQAGIDLLLDVIPIKNILFASEMIGAVRGIDPTTGHYYDDTKRYIDDNTKISAQEKEMIFYKNTQNVFPRLTI